MFETKHLIVRKFKVEDAQQLYENHVDEEVRKWFPNECYADPEEALDAIHFYSDDYDFSNARKNPYADKVKQQITINLNQSTVQYFKELNLQSNMP